MALSELVEAIMLLRLEEGSDLGRGGIADKDSPSYGWTAI